MAITFPLGQPLPFDNGDGFWVAGWFCLAPLMVASARCRTLRSAAALGLAAGLTAYTMVLCWIFPFLQTWAKLSVPEAAGVGGLLILYVSSYTALFCTCVSLSSRRWGSAAAYLLAPAAWTGLELTRATLLTGFPWCLLGASQQAAPAAIQVADLTGTYGVSFVLAAGSSVMALAFDRLTGNRPDGRGSGPWIPLFLVLLISASLAYGGWRLRRAGGVDASLEVALIQANVAQADKWDPAQRDLIEADHDTMTREAARRGAGFIVWSESSVPISLTRHPDYARRLESLADETGAEMLLGTVTYDQVGGTMAPFNSAVMVKPREGISGRYDKLHLVPFGEYVPLKKLLFFLAPLVQEASDFQPGKGINLLSARFGPVGTLICYEAIFPELTRRYARAGASLMVNITNDAWYGDTAMPRQHLLLAAMRAVESRRWLLRCANTGISAVVDPAGRITSRSRLNEKTILAAEVAPGQGVTLYAAVGDAFAICCVILTLAALCIPRMFVPRMFRRRLDPAGEHDVR
jgi:apolipoprotein N-acyltransferase